MIEVRANMNITTWMLAGLMLLVAGSVRGQLYFEETFLPDEMLEEADSGLPTNWHHLFGNMERQRVTAEPLQYVADNGYLVNDGGFWWQRGPTGFLRTGLPDASDALADYLDAYGWLGQMNRTLYVSFLARSWGEGSSASVTLRALRFPADRGTARVGIQLTDEEVFVVVNPAAQMYGRRESLGAVDNEVNLFVFKFEFGAGQDGGDRVSVWRNPRRLGSREPEEDPTKVIDHVPSPNPDREPAALAKVRRSLGFDGVALFVGGTNRWLAFDAFRIGATWAGVTPLQSTP